MAATIKQHRDLAADETRMKRGLTDVHLEHADITREIIGAAFEVHNTLGYGFLEKVYQRALAHELILRNVEAICEAPLRVSYKDTVVGEYFADMLVAGEVVVELKVAQHYQPQDEAQLLNLLKGTGSRVGLLINFGREKLEHKRFVRSASSAFHPRSSAADSDNGGHH